jgi:hypothetical protein
MHWISHFYSVHQFTMYSCRIILQASLPCNQQIEKAPSLISALREYACFILAFYCSKPIAVQQNSSFDILLFLISILRLHGSLLVLCMITSNSYVSNTESLAHRDLHISKQKRPKGQFIIVIQGLPSGQHSEPDPLTQPHP